MKLEGLLILGVFAASHALAAPPTYTIEKVAHEGDPTPGGGTISQLYGDASIDDDGRVAFFAVDSGWSQTLFLWDGASLSVGVAEGDVVPGTGGALVLAPTHGRLAAPDLFAYAAVYDAPGSPFGAFLRDGESDSALLLPGATAPGGGTVTEVDRTHDVNEAGMVAFAGSVDSGGGAVAAHFVGRPGSVSEAFREGGATPIGGVFSGVETYAHTTLAADGSLAFAASVTGGSASSGLFRWNAGTVTPLLSAGDVIPANGGVIQAVWWVSSNEQGHLAFNADVLLPGAPFAIEGVYVLEDGALRKVIHRYDEIPGTNPTLSFDGLLGSTPPDLSADGITIFSAVLTDASLSSYYNALMAEHGGVTQIVALEGDSAPGVAGAVFTNFNDARVNSSGEIAFTALTSAGVGVFVARPLGPASVPALGATALLLSAVAMASSGALFSRRRSSVRSAP